MSKSIPVKKMEMNMVEQNKKLFRLLDRLIGNKDFEGIELLGELVKSCHTSLECTYEIMTEKNEVYNLLIKQLHQ